MANRPGTHEALPVEWARIRVELTGHCYRMLGSPWDAEDAVQETYLRAWRSRGSFDDSKATVRTWLFAIATNCCRDMIKSARRRRELATDMGPSFPVGPDIGDPLPISSWVLPIPDALVLSDHLDPGEVAVQRESIRLAFVAALQLLPGTQRAVLLLRDVLAFSAAEVAAMLGTSNASVNSALYRARATFASRAARVSTSQPDDLDLLHRYCEAFENCDIDTLVDLIHADATSSMPPYPWWLRGRPAIEMSLRAGAQFCAGSRALPVLVNGTTGVAQYTPDETGALRAFALTVLDWREGAVITATTFLTEPDRTFSLFELPSLYCTRTPSIG